MAKLNPVTEYLKNVAKSVKYATVAYIDTNAPATKEFRDTNKELFQDITSAVRNYKGTIMQAESAVKNTPLYRQANAAFENTITAIKTGKFYNKDAEDAAMDAMFNTDEEYQDETQGGGAEGSNFEYSENGPDGADAKQSPVISRGEKSLMKVIHRTSSAQGKRIAGTVEASARYIGGINRASASAVLAQGQQMTSLMQGGFRDIHGGLNELNQFNQSVVKTLAENATQYFQITTGIMQENNAILKEMLEMQRNLYQAQNQDNTEFGGKLYNMVGAEGTPDLKEYGKNIFGNIKKLFNEKSYGMGDMLNEDMLRMFASNPTAAIPGFLISTALGPAVKTSLQQLNSTLSGVFTTAIARLNYNAKKHDGENNMAEILGKIFGVQDIDKNRLDTRSMNNRAVPFDFETRKAIIEIIPSQLSRIESAITGKPAQVYDMKQGRWMSMNEIKENFKNFRKGSISNATYQEQNELAQMMDEIHADRQTMIKIEEAIEKINSKRFDDYGYYDRSGSMAERASRYGVDDEQIMAIVDRMMQNLSKQTKMQSALNFTNAKTGYNNYLKQLENEGTSAYNLLFNGFDKRNALVTDRYDISDKTSKLASAFDLTQQKDKYGLTIYDYLRDIRENTWWGGQSGGYGNGQGNGPTNPTGPRTPHYNDREIMTAAAMNAARQNQADRMWENSQSQIIREAAARGENIPYLRNNERTSEEDMSRLMNNIDTRAQFMKSMQHIGQMEDNTNFLNRAIQEAAEKSRNSTANGEKGPEAAATKSFAKKLVDAATIGQKFGVIAEGLQNLTMKPADLLTGVLTKADESIYGFFFNDTDASSPVVNGEKVKGFAGRMNYELGNLFKKANNWIDTVILGKDENGETHFKERLKEFTGIDIDKIKNDYLIPIKKGISDSIKGAIQTVKDSAKTSWGYAKDAYYNITGKPRPVKPESAAESASETASTAAVNAKEKFKENIADIQQHANGARNVTKTGLTIISKGERIIPSDENIYNPDLKNASRDKDRRNEEKIKQRLNQIFDQSLNIEKHADGTKSYGSSQSEVQKAAIANRPSTEEPGLGKQFMQQIFGDEQTLQGKITYANAVVKKHLPDAAGGAVVGGVAGTLLGGPLVGAVLGSAVNIVSNSEFLQKQLFGEKVVMADGSTRRKGGLFSQETQEMMKKYLPDMKALGITGTILGAVTGLGPIAGLAIGSAIGFAKNNESIQKALFGEHGMFNDKTKKMIKKAFPNMAIGTGAGALGASALLGVGGLGLLPFAVIGAGAGLVSSTDEFKDFLLGKKDEKGNRKGGLAGAIKETMVQPLASFANGLKDQFGDWLKDKMFKPVERAMAPIGKTIELGFKDTINFINKSLKAMFDPVTGIPIFAQIGWMVKKAFGPLETMGKKAAKAAGWIVSRPSAWIGAMGDKMRRSHIKSGNADYMTAQERLKFMGEDDYTHKDVDKKMAGSTVEELENMKEQFELFRKGRGYFDEKTNDTVREMGSTVTQKVGGDTGRASQIMKAVNAGDIEKAINLVDKARNISISQKRELYKYINQKSDELNRLRTKKANYDEDRASILKKLDKMGFKGVNEDNIDKYGSSLDTEIQSRKKLIGENAISDAQAKGDTNMANAAIITGSINDNFAELIPLMAESTQYLAQIAAKGGELSWNQNRVLSNQHKAGVKQATKINKRDDRLSNKINKNISKALHTTKVSKANRFNLLTDNALQDRLFNLGDQGYHLEDINTVLELKPKDRDRYLSLAELGYQVPDPSAIAGLTEKQFNNLTTLAKAGIRITDFDAVKNLDTDEAQIMADLYANGYNQLNQGTLEGLAKTGGRSLLAENDIGTAQKQMRKLNIKDTATEQGIAIGNKISNKYREAVRNATPNAEQQQQTEYIQPEVLNDLVDVPMYANGLKYADRDQLAIVSKGERIERADQPREHLRPQQYQSTLRRNVVDDAELAGRYLYRKVKNRIGGETTSTPASRDTTPMLVSTDYGPIVYDKDANGRLTYNKEATPSNVIKTIDQRDTIMAGISNNLVEIAKVSAEHEGFMKWYKKKEENKKGGILNWIMNAIMYGPLIYKFAKFLAKGLGLNGLSKLLDNLPKKIGDFVFKGIEKIGNKIGDIFGKADAGSKVADILKRFFGHKDDNGNDNDGNTIDINKGVIKAIRQHNEDVVTRLDQLIELNGGVANKRDKRSKSDDENDENDRDKSKSKDDKRDKNSKDGKNKDDKKDNSSKKDNNGKKPGKAEPEKPSDAMKRRPGESKRQYRERRIDEAKRKAAMDKKQKEEPAKPSKIVKDEKTGRNKRSKALEKAQELSNKSNKKDTNKNESKSKIDKPSETVKTTPKSSAPSKPVTPNTSKPSTSKVIPPSKSIMPKKKSRKAKIADATNKAIDKTGDVAQTISDNENEITDLTEDRGVRYLYLNAKKKAGLADADELAELDDIGFDNPLDAIIAASDTFSAGKDLADEFGLTDKFNSGRQWLMDKFHKKQNPDVPDTATPESSSSNWSKQSVSSNSTNTGNTPATNGRRKGESKRKFRERRIAEAKKSQALVAKQAANTAKENNSSNRIFNKENAEKVYGNAKTAASKVGSGALKVGTTAKNGVGSVVNAVSRAFQFKNAYDTAGRGASFLKYNLDKENMDPKERYEYEKAMRDFENEGILGKTWDIGKNVLGVENAIQLSARAARQLGVNNKLVNGIIKFDDKISDLPFDIAKGVAKGGFGVAKNTLKYGWNKVRNNKEGMDVAKQGLKDATGITFLKDHLGKPFGKVKDAGKFAFDKANTGMDKFIDAKRNLDDKVDKAGASINNKFKDMKTAPTGKKKGFSKKALAAGGLAALALPFLASSVAGAATPDSVAEDQNNNSYINLPSEETLGKLKEAVPMLALMGGVGGLVNLLPNNNSSNDNGENSTFDLLQETMDNIDIDDIKKKEQESDKAKDKLKELSEKQKDIVNKSTQPSSPSKAFEDAGKKSSNSLGTKLTDEAKTAEKTAKTMEEAQNGSAILNKGKSVVNSICSKIGNLIGGDKAEAFRKFFMGLYEKIMSAPGNVSKIVKGFAKKAGVAAAGASTGIGGLILGGIEAGLEIKRFYDGYSEAESLLELPPGSATTGMKLFAGAFNALWEFDLNPLNAIFDSKEVLHMAIPAVGKLFGITEDTLRKTKEGAEKDAKSALQTAKDVASSVEERVKMTASSAWDKFKDFGSSIWDDGKKALGNAWDKFKDYGSNLVDKAKNFGSNLWNGAKDLGSKAWNLGSRATTAIGNAISSGIDTVKGGAKAAYNYAANTRLGKALGLGKWGRGIEDIPQEFINGLSDYNKINDSDDNLVRQTKEANIRKLYDKSKHQDDISTSGFFSQRDPRVANLPFNISGDTEKQTVGDSFCGEATGLNVLSDFGINGSFKDAYNMGLKNKEKNGGTYPKFYNDFLGKYGLKIQRLTKDQAKRESGNGTTMIGMGTDDTATKENDKAFGGKGNATPYGSNPHWISFKGQGKFGKGNNVTVKDPESNKPEQYDSDKLIEKSSHIYAVVPKNGKGKGIQRHYTIMNKNGSRFGRAKSMNRDVVITPKMAKTILNAARAKWGRASYGYPPGVTDEKMWALANWTGEKTNINPKFLYAQWYHESKHFQSELSQYYNFGGITGSNDAAMRQPDGDCNYMPFNGPEDFASYDAWYLNRCDGVSGLSELHDFTNALKANGYYGADPEEYYQGCKRAMDTINFGAPNMSLIDQAAISTRDVGSPGKPGKGGSSPAASSNGGNNNGSNGGKKKLGGIFGELADITSTLAGAFSLGSDSSSNSNGGNNSNNNGSTGGPIAGASGLDMQYIESNHPGDESQTNLSNINPMVKTLVNQFAKDYYGRHNKKLLITGGAELGYHSKGIWSHGNGYKTDVDVDFNEQDKAQAHQLGASVSFESDHYDIDWSGHDSRDQDHPHNAIYSSTPPSQPQGKWGRSKYGRGLEGIPQEFIDGLSDYNKISDSDDLLVRHAKEANIRKLYSRQQQSKPNTAKSINSFDMSKIPEYNRISPDDDLFVQRMKKMSWRKYGYTGEGKWGRGIANGIKDTFQNAISKLKDTSKSKLENISRKFGKGKFGRYKWGRGDGTAAYQALIKAGFNDVAASGVLGNIMAESTLNPSADNGTHHGLCQWDHNDRWPRAQAWMKANGYDPESMEGQIAYAYKEASDMGLISAMNGASSPEEAAKIWDDKFEISGGGTIDKRQSFAASAYKSKGADLQASGASSGMSGGSNGGSSNSGIFKGIANIASKMAGQMKKLLGPMATAVKSMSEKVFGSDLKLLFGDSNPFGSIFGSDSGNSGGGGNNGSSSGSNSPGGSTEVPKSGSAGDKVLEMLKKGDSGAEISSPYGKTRSDGLVHGGIDYGANSGTPIYTPVDGKVFDLGSGYGGGYGNFVQIQDAQGNYHMFAHCDTQTVNQGQSVKAGDQVGTVGSTGHSTGPHLHYEIDPPNNPGAVKGGPHFNPGEYGAGKWGRGKWGRGIEDIPQEFINGLSDYNKINDTDSNLVKQAKEANIRRLYEKSKNIVDTPAESASTFDMNKIPEYNRINPDDDLFVQRMKKKSWRKYGYTGEGKYGRGGFKSWIKRIGGAIGDFATDVWHGITGKPTGNKSAKDEDNKTVTVTNKQQKIDTNTDKKASDAALENDIGYIMTDKAWQDSNGKNPTREEAIKILNKDKKYNGTIAPDGKTKVTENDIKYIMTAKEWQDSTGKNPTREEAIKILMKKQDHGVQSKDGKGKWGRGLDDIPQEFINSLSDYNKINDEDDLMVRKAKEANIRKLYEKSKSKVLDPANFNKFDMSKVPEYNRISPDDDLFVQKMKKMSWRKYGYTGEGKWGRGDNPIQNYYSAEIDKKYKVGNIKNRVDFILHPHKRFLDDGGMKTVEDIKNHIKDVPEAAIDPMNKIDYKNDDLTVMRAKAKKIREIYDSMSPDEKAKLKNGSQPTAPVTFMKAPEPGKNLSKDANFAQNRTVPGMVNKTANSPAPKLFDDMPLAMEVGPNGKNIDENDIKYIMTSDKWKDSTGKNPTREQAIAILQKDKKYAISPSTAVDTKTSTGNKSDDSSKESEEDKRKSAIEKEAQKILSQFGSFSGGSDILSILKNTQLENRHVEINKDIDPSKVLKGEKDEDKSSGKEESKDHKELENDIKFITTSDKWQINGKNPTRDEAIAILKKDPKYKDKDIDKILKESGSKTDDKKNPKTPAESVKYATKDGKELENDIKYIMESDQWKRKDGSHPTRDEAIAILKKDPKYKDKDIDKILKESAEASKTDDKKNPKTPAESTKESSSDDSSKESEEDKKKSAIQKEAEKILRQTGVSSGGSDILSVLKNSQLENRHIEIDKTVDPSKILKGEKDKDESSGKEESKEHKDLENDIKYIMNAKEWQINGKNPTRDEAIAILKKDPKYKDKDIDKILKEESGSTDEKEKGVNGKTIDENDIKYIMTAKEWQDKDGKNPSREQAIAILKNDKKYSVNTTDTKDDSKKSSTTSSNSTTVSSNKTDDKKNPQTPAEAVKDAKNSSTSSSGTSSSDFGPNGKPIDENDIKFIMTSPQWQDSTGKNPSREQAIKILQNDVKYAVDVTSGVGEQKAEDNKKEDEKKNPETPAKTIEKEKAKEDDKKKEEEKKQDSSKKTEDKKTEEKKDEDKKSEIKTPAESIKSNNKDKEELENDIKYIMTAKEWQRSDGSHPTRDEAIAILKKDPKYKDKDIDKILSGNVPSESVKVPEPGKDLKKENNFDTKKGEKKSEDNKKPQAPAAVVKAPEPGKGLSKGANFDLSKDKKSKQATPVKEQKQGTLKERIDNILHPYKRFGDDHGLKTVEDIKNYIKGIPEEAINPENRIDWDNDDLLVMRAKAIRIKQDFAQTPDQKKDVQKLLKTPAKVVKAPEVKKPEKAKDEKKKPEEVKEKKGTLKERIDAILHPYKRFGDDHGLKTVEDIKKYIQDVPDSFISDDNKIDWEKDDLLVMRMKALKIRQLYDAHLKEAGITPQESKAKAVTIDPNKPKDTNTVDKNTKDTANKVAGALAVEVGPNGKNIEENDIKYIMTAKEWQDSNGKNPTREEAIAILQKDKKYAIDNTNKTQAEDEKKKAEEEKKKQEAEAKQKAAEEAKKKEEGKKQASETKSNSDAKSDDKTQTASSENSVKFDKMIELLSSIDQSLKAIAGANAISGGSTTTGKSTSNTIRNSAPSPSVEQFDAIARNMSKLATM